MQFSNPVSFLEIDYYYEKLKIIEKYLSLVEQEHIHNSNNKLWFKYRQVQTKIKEGVDKVDT